MSLYVYIMLIGGAALYYSFILRDQKVTRISKDSQSQKSGDELNLVNLSSLKGDSLREQLLIRINSVYNQLGKKGILLVLSGITLISIAMSYLLGVYLALGFVSGMAALAMTPLASAVLLFRFLLRRRQKQFEASFPDAINLMTSAVSSGESVMQAIQFVGNRLDTVVGQEFKWMGQRLQIGESPDEVFRRTSQNCPYKSYRFFIITLRANMVRGGQLKEVMTRLNRVLFDARTVEKRTLAMTSEARLSAKIVGAIPFLFLFGMQFMSPENFQFVLHDPQGRMILYYLIGSEAIGMGIIWFLIRGIR